MNNIGYAYDIRNFDKMNKGNRNHEQNYQYGYNNKLDLRNYAVSPDYDVRNIESYSSNIPKLNVYNQIQKNAPNYYVNKAKLPKVDSYHSNIMHDNDHCSITELNILNANKNNIDRIEQVMLSPLNAMNKHNHQSKNDIKTFNEPFSPNHLKKLSDKNLMGKYDANSYIYRNQSIDLWGDPAQNALNKITNLSHQKREYQRNKMNNHQIPNNTENDIESYKPEVRLNTMSNKNDFQLNPIKKIDMNHNMITKLSYNFQKNDKGNSFVGSSNIVTPIEKREIISNLEGPYTKNLKSIEIYANNKVKGNYQKNHHYHGSNGYVEDLRKEHPEKTNEENVTKKNILGNLNSNLGTATIILTDLQTNDWDQREQKFNSDITNKISNADKFNQIKNMHSYKRPNMKRDFSHGNKQVYSNNISTNNVSDINSLSTNIKSNVMINGEKTIDLSKKFEANQAGMVNAEMFDSAKFDKEFRDKSPNLNVNLNDITKKLEGNFNEQARCHQTGFQYINFESLEELKNPKKELLEIEKNLISEKNWMNQFDAQNKLRSIFKHHKSVIEQAGYSINNFIGSIIKLTENLRSGLSKTAQICLKECIIIYKKALDRSLDLIIKKLLKKIQETNVFISSEVKSSLFFLCEHCTTTRVLSVLNKYFDSKIEIIRVSVCDCYTKLFELYAHEMLMSKEYETSIFNLANLIADQSAKVRKAAKYSIRIIFFKSPEKDTIKNLFKTYIPSKADEIDKLYNENLVSSKRNMNTRNHNNADRQNRTLRLANDKIKNESFQNKFSKTENLESKQHPRRLPQLNCLEVKKENKSNDNQYYNFIEQNNIEEHNQHPPNTNGNVEEINNDYQQEVICENEEFPQKIDSTMKKVPKKAIMYKHYAELEELDPFLIQVSSNEWQKRINSIDKIIELSETYSDKMSKSKYLVKVFDAFMTLVVDSNTKVQSYALGNFGSKLIDIFYSHQNEAILLPSVSTLINLFSSKSHQQKSVTGDIQIKMNNLFSKDMIRKIGKGLVKNLTSRIKLSILETQNGKVNDQSTNQQPGFCNFLVIFQTTNDKSEINYLKNIINKLAENNQYLEAFPKANRNQVELIINK